MSAGAGLVERGQADFAERARADVLAALVRLLADEQVPYTTRVEGGEALGRLGDPRLLDLVRGDAAGIGAIPGTPGYWCAIEPATFAFGDERYEELRPATVQDSYLIARYPVTNAEFARFLAANGPAGYDLSRPWWTPHGRAVIRRAHPRFWQDRRYANPAQPVIGVSWYEAVAYCRWLTTEGRTRGWLSAAEAIRLPTWLEWELVARGGTGHRYPWGDDEPNAERASYAASALGRPVPVGCFPAGPQPVEP